MAPIRPPAIQTAGMFNWRLKVSSAPDTSASLDPIDGASHWRVSFRSGQVIYDEGDLAQSVYRVETGCVRLQVNGLEGRRQIVTFLFPGDLFGLSVSRSTSAEAVTASDLTRYPLQAVLNLTTTSTEVVIQLISNMDALVNDIAQHVSRVAHLPATERLVWFFEWIIEHRGAADPGGAVELPMSHRDIADYLGLSPETLSRGFKTLQRQGVLRRKSRRSFLFQRHKVAIEGVSNLPDAFRGPAGFNGCATLEPN